VGLAQQGLHIVRPLTPASAAQAGFSLDQVLAGARGALVVGDGGGDFFAGFAAAGVTGPDPLDRYTEQVIPAVLAAVLPSGSYALRFPFAGTLPMQRLGEAAGLPPAGPLGIQIHPLYGPWWAYRALVVLAQSLPLLPPLASPCVGCPAPCVAACPGHAVGATAGGGFDVGACAQHRLGHAPCEHGCAARRACVVGPAQAYSAAQLGFHMAASLAMVRAYLGGPPGAPRS
jgi:epoxyqueuosine reductase